MAHHRHAPDTSRFDGKESPGFDIHSVEAPHPAEKHSSGEVEKEKQEIRLPGKKKGFFDHTIAGFPWTFFVEMVVIAIGLLGLLLKVIGIF